MKFPKELLQELAWSDDDPVSTEFGDYVKVNDEIYDTSRWSIMHEMIFKTPEGKHYRTCYSVGATEQQDESPFEYDPSEIKCTEVHQVEKTVLVWETV